MNTAYACGSKIRSGALHLTSKVDYGLYLLAALHTAGESRSIRTLAHENHLSFAFLQKVAGLLQKAGYITAIRGKNGGYILARQSNKISVHEVIEALEGPIAISECSKGEGRCIREKFCAIRSGIRRMNDEIRDHYSSRTIADLAA